MKYARRYGEGTSSGKPWVAPAAPAKSHEGSGFAGRGEQGVAVCPVCEATLKTIKAAFSDVEAGVVYGKTIMIGNHRPGGGRASKSEYPCKGSMTAVQSLNE